MNSLIGNFHYGYEKGNMLVKLCIFLVFGVIRETNGISSQQLDSGGDEIKTYTLGKAVNLEVGGNGISINLKNHNNNIVLTGNLAHERDTRDMITCQSHETNSGLCFQWKNGPRIEIYEADVGRLGNTSNIHCLTINTTLADGRGELKDTPEDCFTINDNLWFGGFEEHNQAWPLSTFKIGSTPFITGGFGNQEFGNVIEGLFISSAGVGVFVEETTPLYLSINDSGSNRICLKGKVGNDTPFFLVDRPHLLYDMCVSPNITTLWKGMSERYLPKPQRYPSPDIIRRPIWTTWATFKANINQAIVLKFAEDIKKSNFSISQLEIDDNWTPHYGDFTFDTKHFPNAKELITNLTKLGIPTTVWVHWFFNNDSDTFRELNQAGFLIKEFDSNRPLLVSWWDGSNAGVLDFTNKDAVTWYLKKMADLKTNYNVTSFKFDAGEVKWVRQKRYKVKNNILTPNYLTTKYAEVASQADGTERRQELRTAFRSQAASNLIRMLDRNSVWSHDTGLKTVIPCSLVFGLMGYPYILPDIIGGNAKGTFPDSELFIRWLQVNTFLPILQFSIPPWYYKNETITAISHKFVELHERYADKMNALAKNAQQTGEPIIRPLWWIAPTDKDALTLDSEFLLGDDLLVAPVLEKGARSRDIYLPAGHWHDELRNINRNGGAWLRNYKAELDELPYFTKL